MAGLCLARTARIHFHESSRGFIVKTSAGSTLVPLSQPILDPDALLELLDGSHDLDTIARSAGITIEDLEQLLAELRRFHLLDDDPSDPPLIADRRRFLGEPPETMTGSARVPVLMVGLGEPGLAVLRELLASGHFIVSLFDPLPVRAD